MLHGPQRRPHAGAIRAAAEHNPAGQGPDTAASRRLCDTARTVSLRPSRSGLPGAPRVPALAREVALPHTPQLLQVRTRLFLLTLGAFLLLALPLAGLASAALLRGVHQTFADRALRESRLVATLPPVVAALSGNAAERAGLNTLINRYRLTLGAAYVVVTDRTTRRLTHPELDRIGEKMVGGDFQSFLRGQSVTETVQGTLGRSVRAKVPVVSGRGEVLGLASVGFLLPQVRDVFWQVIRAALPWYLGALLLALGLARALARRIGYEMLDLEPEQIAGALLSFRAVLNSLDEGVVVARGDQVHVMNPQARALLGVQTAELPAPLPAPLRGLPDTTTPLDVGGRPLLVSAREVEAGAQGGGGVTQVITLRDLARVRELADELTQAQRYAELLRAQTHEFTNRLHTLAGLIHLGETGEALRLIHTQAGRHQAHAGAVGRLRHLRLAALLLGKYDRAAEVGVELILDPLCALPARLPTGVPELLELAAGNLIENAFEALAGRPGAEVRVLIAADPEGVVLEVRDNGPGVPPELAQVLGERGRSSKGQGRGVGLSLVRTRAQALGATLSHDRPADERGQPWTRFTLDLPLPEETT